MPDPTWAVRVLRNTRTGFYYVAVLHLGRVAPWCRTIYGPAYLYVAEATEAARVESDLRLLPVWPGVLHFNKWAEVLTPEEPKPQAKKGKRK